MEQREPRLRGGRMVSVIAALDWRPAPIGTDAAMREKPKCSTYTFNEHL